MCGLLGADLGIHAAAARMATLGLFGQAFGSLIKGHRHRRVDGAGIFAGPIAIVDGEQSFKALLCRVVDNVVHLNLARLHVRTSRICCTV